MSTFQVIACMVLGWFVFDVLLSIIIGIVKNHKIKKEAESVLPQDADPSKLCKGPHSWITARTLTKEGSGTTQVCRVCGFISGSGKVASMESVDRIEESNKIREIETRLLKEFLDQEDDQMKKFFDSEIKGGLSFNKIAQIHSAGMTFEYRFMAYKASKADEIEKELTRSDA